MGAPLAILNSGLVTSVGLTAPATCAAIRAGLTNPTETRFKNTAGDWLVGHSVELEVPWRGRAKLARMAARAIAESLAATPSEEWKGIPLVLCVAEKERTGRLDGVDTELFGEIEQELGVQFLASDSLVIPQGRAGIGTAMGRAREIFAKSRVQSVLVAAADSLLTWPTLAAYEQQGRLLTPQNSNGFIPGEAAGALLLGPPQATAQLYCTGIGSASEPATIYSEQPLRAEGLTLAIKRALADADCELHEVGVRIADLAGEQYYFKEAALALNRLLRVRVEDLPLWHPAECVGEVGAASGVVCLAVALAAMRKGYAPGERALLHFSTDRGERVGIVAATH